MYSYQQVSGRLAVSDVGEFTDSAVVVGVSFWSITTIPGQDKRKALKSIVE
jgi:hypothetical protein